MVLLKVIVHERSSPCQVGIVAIILAPHSFNCGFNHLYLLRNDSHRYAGVVFDDIVDLNLAILTQSSRLKYVFLFITNDTSLPEAVNLFLITVSTILITGFFLFPMLDWKKNENVKVWHKCSWSSLKVCFQISLSI